MVLLGITLTYTEQIMKVKLFTNDVKKLERLVRPVLMGDVDAFLENGAIELLSLFHRVNTKQINTYTVYVDSSLLQTAMQFLVRTRPTMSESSYKTDVWQLMVLIGHKLNICQKAPATDSFYVYFDEMDNKISRIKAFRTFMASMKSVLGISENGLLFSKIMIESEIYIGPCTQAMVDCFKNCCKEANIIAHVVNRKRYIPKNLVSLKVAADRFFSTGR